MNIFDFLWRQNLFLVELDLVFQQSRFRNEYLYNTMYIRLFLYIHIYKFSVENVC